MYELADKYAVAGLKELCCAKFASACIRHWGSDQFARAAHLVFSTTPDSDMDLRNVVSRTVAERISLLDKPEIQSIMQDFNGLAFGVLQLRKNDLF